MQYSLLSQGGWHGECHGDTCSIVSLAKEVNLIGIVSLADGCSVIGCVVMSAAKVIPLIDH